MNVDFEINNIRINARVSAIIYNKDKNKVLLFKVEDGRDYYMLSGGRIELNESSINAIIREIKEELNFDLTYKLCAIEENFIKKDGKNNMQYSFIYKAIYDDEIIDNVISCLDDNNQKFYWIDIDKIDNYKIFPKSVYELVKDQTGSIIHFCNDIVID